MLQKSLDRKLAAIHADPSGAKDFILADAKDADMAFGIGSPGKSPEAHSGEVRMRTLAEYRQNVRNVIQQKLVDIMLMSASTNDLLTHGERLFDNSPVTPAGRANDTSDVFVVRGGRYLEPPAKPFRSASLDHIQCGHLDCEPQERQRGANLGLYSVTFNNRLEDDLRTLEEYNRFRLEAEAKGFRHFLEVFDPNAPCDLNPDQVPAFINDMIARTLAGVAQAGRPVFLKIVYHGPRAMEEIVAYDPHLVVGILGGAAGTTYDAFKMLADAQKYGARAALYGRKINSAECQLGFIEMLRLIADRQISPEEAVRAYHGVLQRLKIRPNRPLEEDLQLQSAAMSYGGPTSVTVPAKPASLSSNGKPAVRRDEPAEHGPAPDAAIISNHATSNHDCGCGGPDPNQCHCHEHADGNAKAAAPKQTAVRPSKNGKPPATPDFSRMTAAEKLKFNKARLDRIFGG